MSTRYVFGLYNVRTSTSSTTSGSYSISVASSETTSSSSSTFTTAAASTGYYGVRVFYASTSTSASTLYNMSQYNYASTAVSGISVAEAVVTYRSSSSVGTLVPSSSSVSSDYYYKVTYATLNSNDIDDYKTRYTFSGLWKASDSTALAIGYDTGTVTVTGYKVTVSAPTTTTSTTYSQGTTFYNYLYGDSADSYTTGRNTSGDYSGYWITYVGTDSITPTLKITKSGYDMTSTITASSSATYGGDIYYLLETACNERDYETAQDSQTLTYTETVDSDTVYYYSMVTAYCDGFTDETVTASYTISQSGTRYVWDKLDEEGGTSQGYVASSSLSAYPLDAEDDDGYWYDYLGSDTPDATAVSATTTGKAGATVTLKITAAGSSSNVYGGTIYYTVKRYHRTSSSGSYSSTTISSKTTATTVTTTIPSGGYYDCYYTVTTSCSYGYTGTTAVKTSTITIINNAAPTIDITSVGTISDFASFAVSFDIADEDGDAMDVTLSLDGTQLTSWSDQTDGTLSYTVTTDTLLTLLNGSHTFAVTASDSSETTTATETWSKDIGTCTATWNEAKETSSIIEKLYIGWIGSLPDDATVTMKVTNDNGVTWEDASDEFLSGDTFCFDTTEADTPAFNFQLTIVRGDTEGYVDDIIFILSTGESGEYGNTVCTLTHIAGSSTHTFTGLNGRTGLIPVQFKSTGDYTSGEDATLDGDEITINTMTGATASFEASRGVLGVVDTATATLTLQM